MARRACAQGGNRLRNPTPPHLPTHKHLTIRPFCYLRLSFSRTDAGPAILATHLRKISDLTRQQANDLSWVSNKRRIILIDVPFRGFLPCCEDVPQKEHLRTRRLWCEPPSDLFFAVWQLSPLSQSPASPAKQPPRHGIRMPPTHSAYIERMGYRLCLWMFLTGTTFLRSGEIRQVKSDHTSLRYFLKT